jgi:hypothetical protein
MDRIEIFRNTQNINFQTQAICLDNDETITINWTVKAPQIGMWL